MNFATTLRYINLQQDTAWDIRYGVPYYWHLMAKNCKIGLNAVMSEYDIDGVCKNCDGLFVPGSSTDINPKYWGGEPFAGVQEADEFPLDSKLVEYFINSGKPIFGICGGLQAINIYLGGSLKRVENHNNPEKRIHNINIEKNSFVYDVFEKTTATVNSYHFWAIDKVAPGLRVVAESDEGVIEAVEWKEKNIFATQWHPERSFAEGDRIENKFFENFVETCRKVNVSGGKTEL